MQAPYLAEAEASSIFQLHACMHPPAGCKHALRVCDTPDDSAIYSFNWSSWQTRLSCCCCCCRAPDTIPADAMAVYYSQRATQGGLLISEATCISQQGQG
jgi:hypothetical protein